MPRRACTSAQSRHSLRCLQTQFMELQEASGKEQVVRPHMIIVHGHLKGQKGHCCRVTIQTLILKKKDFSLIVLKMEIISAFSGYLLFGQ